MIPVVLITLIIAAILLSTRFLCGRNPSRLRIACSSLIALVLVQVVWRLLHAKLAINDDSDMVNFLVI